MKKVLIILLIILLFGITFISLYVQKEQPPAGGGPLVCDESWSCTSWSSCVNNTRTRICTDKNNCNTTKLKPIENDSCSDPISPCGNGICDNGETCTSCQDDCGKCNKENCLTNEMCQSKHCVHNVCRPSPQYCGDKYCDTGENCSSCPVDCGICPSPCCPGSCCPPCTPSWGNWENQGCGVSCGGTTCLATEQCQRKSDGCGNYQYKCIAYISCEAPITTNITKQDYFDFGEQLLINVLNYTTINYVDYQGNQIPIVDAQKSLGSVDGNTRLALSLAMYSNITGKKEIEKSKIKPNNVITLIRGLINSQLLERPITFSKDVSSTLHLFGDNLNNNPLWQNLTEIEKTYWKKQILPRHTQWNSESFEAYAAWYSYKFGWNTTDKTPEWFDAQLNLYTSEGWQKPEYNIYSWFSIAFLKNLQYERSLEGLGYSRIDELEKYYRTQSEHIKYATGTNGEVWTWGRSTGAYGIGFMGPIENAIRFNWVNEDEKGIFKRIAHLSFLRSKNYYYNETLGLLDTRKKPYSEMIVYNFSQIISANAQFIQSLFVAYMNANESVKESKLPAETQNYEKYFVFNEKCGVKIFNEIKGKHYSNITCLEEEINKNYILNYLNYSLYHPSDTLNFIFTLDSYEILNEPIPNKAQVIEYLNSLQSDEGTWNTGKYHYVPTTASVLMFYNRSGVRPPKSLDPFFSTVDTWEKVNAHVNIYDGDNYWGGLWGYVTSYVVYKHEAPPWTPEFLNELNTKFDSWANYSHQRTHLVGSLYMLGLPIPRVDEVVTITLQQQKGDGSWEFHEPETVFNIDVLGLLRNQTTVDKTLIDSAIAKGIEYVKKCYRTVDVDGKTYGLFVKNSTLICSSSCLTSSFSWYTAQGIFAVLNPTSDIWTRWIVNETSSLQNEIAHTDNSLEYLRNKGLGVHDMAEYVISKSYLGTQVPNKQQIIDYFDNNQGTDGSWKGVNTPMFTTHRVLLAYYLLNATPKKSLDSFFSNYDTWEKALKYDLDNHYNKFDGRDIYHIVIGWFLYYRTYPIWLNDFFTEVEKDLTWTTSTNSHKRTHILYSYVMARRQFPNLDGIINETLKEQSSDGHWNYQCLSSPREVYCNAIQLVLLQQILKLYPSHRTAEIQNSIDRSRQWVYDTYNTTIVSDVIMGYFGTATNIEDSLMTGIMSAGINGLMDINVDMTFEDLIKNLKIESHSYIMDLPVYPVDTVPKPLQGHSEVVMGWFPWSHGILYDENGEFLRYHMSLREVSKWTYFKIFYKGSEYIFTFDVNNYNFTNGILTLVNGSTKLIIDYHTPHNITLVYGPGYLTFTATYRGAPLWYSKTLDPDDMLIVPESNGRFGGYDAPIKIVGKLFDGTTIKNFNGYGDWEHVWFLGGGWSAPKRLWMIFNDDKYYGAVAELKYLNGTIAWHVGRFGEVGGPSYVFDDFQWSDDGKTLPLSVELKGPIRDVNGVIKGNVDLKTDPQKANSITSYWMLYQNISGSVISDTFNNGTAWAEIRK